MPRQAAPTGIGDPYRGRKIGKYETLTRISVGGMAELFLAFTSGPGGFRKFVALKQILPDVKTDEFVEMFLDEARITAGFSHPNIGQVFDLGLEDDELYLAMEFISGQNLEQVLIAASHVRPLPTGFAARVARDVCLGLHYAHNFTAPSGRKVAVVHRDMAPRNVMITYDGVVKVIDFGIAKARGRIARTYVGMVKGTSGYMSPEQVRGQELDGRSDLFTAGVLLHEMLCGRRVFDTSDEDAMMRQIAEADIAPPRQINPDVPEALDAVVVRALAKDPSKRFSTGREMAKAIEVAVGTEIFDEEGVAELMQALFADKRLKTLALLDYASHDDDRVSEIMVALQDGKVDQRTVNRKPEEDASDIQATSPMISLPSQQPPSRPPPVRASSSNSRSSSPPSARPFFATPPRARPDSSPRKPLPVPLEEDAPTQIGPLPGMEEPTAPPSPETRRPSKMGSFTLGSAASPGAAEPQRLEDDSETSELSQVSRVTRAGGGLKPRARRGLWFILAIVLLGLGVLFMPESLRSRAGEQLEAVSKWVSERIQAPAPAPEPTPPPEPEAAPPSPPPANAPTPSPAVPPQDAYEPPPPAEDAAPEEAAVQPPAPTSAPFTRPKRRLPPGVRAAPPAKAPPIHARPGEQAPSESIEKAPEPMDPSEEPEEASVGPAEVDPSIRPLELASPATGE